MPLRSPANPAPDAPAITLFPLYGRYRGMVDAELDGLTDAHLDWDSDRWEWAGWSIRRNVSHVASHLFRWYLLRWGNQLFPAGIPFEDEVHDLAALPHRRLDEERWWDIAAITGKLDQALEMVRGILQRETVESIRIQTIPQEKDVKPFHAKIADRYPGTLIQDSKNSDLWHITLEGTLHHSEGELVTHLYNVQRLKRAQGLQARVELPQIGYWTLPDWDRSES